MNPNEHEHEQEQAARHETPNAVLLLTRWS